MLYPLFFEPVLKEKIWGGDALNRKYKRKLPSNKIGESWEIACHSSGMSVVKNGELKGKTLQSLIDIYGRDLLGNALSEQQIKKFPLLIKFLDASDVLSVQVHPGDEYAFKYENGESGKTEMWYVIDAKPGANLIYGIKQGITREEFNSAILNGDLEHCLNKLEVQAGDVVYIPAGMVHAIGEGILICEIQQNSDTTYRVYDWNRVDDNGNQRELHIKQALNVIDFDGKYNRQKITGLSIESDGNIHTYYIADKYFAVEKLNITGPLNDRTDGQKFCTFTVIEGKGTISYTDGNEQFIAGQSFMIPACLGDYTIDGQCSIVKAYVPDIENDIVKPLKSYGFTREQMKHIAGL